jgi:hypothetical protein
MLAALAICACTGNATDDHTEARNSGALGNEGAHEHGIARLNIAVDGNVATIELHAPGQTLYGFEGEPASAAQGDERDRALDLLRNDFHSLFVFDTRLGCVFGKAEVEITEHDGHDEHGAKANGEHDDEEEHSEVQVRAEVRCTTSPAGSNLRLALTEKFPQLLRVDMQVLSEATQSGSRIDARSVNVRL